MDHLLKEIRENQKLMQQLFPNVKEKEWNKLNPEQIRRALEGYISRTSGKNLVNQELALLETAQYFRDQLHDVMPQGGYGLPYLGAGGSRRMARDHAKKRFVETPRKMSDLSVPEIDAPPGFSGEIKG